MSEELKNECKCCERCERIAEGIKEFAFKAGIVYVGVTLAILTSATILKPKHHHGMFRPYPGIERQLPPQMMHGQFMPPRGPQVFAPEGVKRPGFPVKKHKHMPIPKQIPDKK